jgi:hypothetical protein
MLEVIEMQDLNGTWDGKHGDFSSGRLKFSGQGLGIQSNQVSVPIRKEDDRYFVDYQDLEFVYKPAPESLINGLKKLVVRNATLVYHPQKILQLKTSGIDIAQEQGQQSIPRLTLRCRNLAVDTKAAVDGILVPCLSATTLKIPVLSLNAFSAKKFNAAMDNKISVDKLENIYLNIYKESFDASFKAKYIFNWTVKLYGTIRYSSDKKYLDLYLRSAKAGFINVKKTILKQIAEAKLDSIKVVGDHLYIKI